MKKLLVIQTAGFGYDFATRHGAREIGGLVVRALQPVFPALTCTVGTASWTLIELLRHPEEMALVDAELADLYSGGDEVSYQALREMPHVESAIKEALRLHPPLILLLRVAKEDVECEGYTIEAGQMVGASPAVSNRLAEDFPEPDAFRPSRYLDPLEEDRNNPWTWIPFGAGRHRCVVTAEDGIRVGGAGSHIAAALEAAAATEGRISPPVTLLGTPKGFLAQAKPDVILAELGLDAPSIAASSRAAWSRATTRQQTQS